MTHKEAWRRLPDLLEDRDDAQLLDHVRDCTECQRQLFLLGRVDRMLRDRAAVQPRSPTRTTMLRLFATVAAVVVVGLAAATGLGAFSATHATLAHEFTLRTEAGRPVAQARMTSSDAHNVTLALTAHNFPTSSGHMFVLWATDNHFSLQVGRFMVTPTGSCHVRFNLPASHSWRHFRVTVPGQATEIVASST